MKWKERVKGSTDFKRMHRFEKECIDLNNRDKCFNIGSKLKWDFPIMSSASKEWLFGSDSLTYVNRHIFNFDCWECMYYVLMIAFFCLNFSFIKKSWIAAHLKCIASFKMLYINSFRSLFFKNFKKGSFV